MPAQVRRGSASRKRAGDSHPAMHSREISRRGFHRVRRHRGSAGRCDQDRLPALQHEPCGGGARFPQLCFQMPQQCHLRWRRQSVHGGFDFGDRALGGDSGTRVVLRESTLTEVADSAKYPLRVRPVFSGGQPNVLEPPERAALSFSHDPVRVTGRCRFEAEARQALVKKLVDAVLLNVRSRRRLALQQRE